MYYKWNMPGAFPLEILHFIKKKKNNNNNKIISPLLFVYFILNDIS